MPLVFSKGEAFQFDWSEESVDLGGLPVKAYVAYFRLCHSRMFCIAFTRMSLEMVFAAHAAADIYTTPAFFLPSGSQCAPGGKNAAGSAHSVTSRVYREKHMAGV